jgi:hypothetical protein
MRTGLTFSTIPQSNHQTSPRLGGTLFLADHCRQLVTGGSRDIVTERAGIPRRQMMNQLLHKLFFFLNRQRLEFGKQFYGSRIHAVNLYGGELNVTRKPDPGS